MPITCCISRLTAVMPAQHTAPKAIGLPPDFTSSTRLLFRPMAAMAMVMKNLLSSFSGAKTSAETPAIPARVVITEAITKYRRNIGNARFRLKLFLPEPEDLRARWMARPKVIGIIASVRVSFTVTALFRVSAPRFHMLSQVAAAAVTEEVSLIAVPAKMPKASPLWVSKPMAAPSIGKKMAAITLKKKMTEIA